MVQNKFKGVKIMGFAKKNTKGNIAANEKNINTNATVTLNGRLIDVFEGEKYNYAKVECDRTKKKPNSDDFYYDTFSVKFDKSIELPNDETTVSIIGTLSAFFDKSINRTVITIDGQSIQVSN